MKNKSIPIPLARGAMLALPAVVLNRGLTVLVQKMAARRPRLFANLARLSPAVVLIEPTDVPHRFELHIGIPQPYLTLCGFGAGACSPADQRKPDAVIRGSLATLFDMLEGRSDGDTLFFSRDIVITGDTEVVVGLRNTLDREEIEVMDDLFSLAGPFAKPLEHAMRVMYGLSARYRTAR